MNPSILNIVFGAILSLAISQQAWANISLEQKAQFKAIYEKNLGSIYECSDNQRGQYALCSRALKNSGNAPRIYSQSDARATVVLFHGLSDSPFFMRSIAEHLNRGPYRVILPLTPGHGQIEADADMQDPDMLQAWRQHMAQVMQFAHDFGDPVFVGGFSTGGAFATEYSLQNPDQVAGLMLFSAALALSEKAESMHKIWGIKWLAKWMDGYYQTNGPNKYKYPSVAAYAGLTLMDMIVDIRQQLATQQATNSLPELNIFVAHSLADKVTPFTGVEDLTTIIAGEHTVFTVAEEYDLCHADLPLDSVQIVQIQFDESQVKAYEHCAVPQANPLHRQMLAMLDYYMAQQLPESGN